MSEEYTMVLKLWEETFGETDEEENFFVIEDGDWVDDGKYSHRSSIVKYHEHFWEINESRSGSYFTEYDYGEPEAHKVIPHTETITRTVYKRVA